MSLEETATSTNPATTSTTNDTSSAETEAAEAAAAALGFDSKGSSSSSSNADDNTNDSDGNVEREDFDRNPFPPSDDIATTAAKLGDDDDDDDGNAGEEVAIKKEEFIVVYRGIDLVMETGGDPQQQHLPPLDAMVLPQQEGELEASPQHEAAEAETEGGVVAAGVEGDGFGDGDDERVVCQPIPTTTTEETTPTHERTNSDTLNNNNNRKKRLCRHPGCTRVIKSQGHCQRHGAKAKRCKVEGCEKQAQGTHNGMCKRHWRAVHFPDQVANKAEAARKKELEEQPPEPYGESVYDTVLPNSIAYRPSFSSAQAQQASHQTTNGNGNNSIDAGNANSNNVTASEPGGRNPSNGGASNDHPVGQTAAMMPLVVFLRDGALHKDVGWHRQEERRARGIFPCASLSTQLEPWEKQLALVEILLLSGGTPHANFKHLAHAWGRERGFHQVLSSSVCCRRGEVERKKRSDAGLGKKQKLQQKQQAALRTTQANGSDSKPGASPGKRSAQSPPPVPPPNPIRPKPSTPATIHPSPQRQPQLHAPAVNAAQANYQPPAIPWQQQAQDPQSQPQPTQIQTQAQTQMQQIQPEW